MVSYLALATGTGAQEIDAQRTYWSFHRFLLKYTARDEIELLGRGNGGIVEIRNAIASYEEPSPLFGFLRYRRRNVIIKYVPEDCSRLVQGEYLALINMIYLGWDLINI